MTLLEVIDHLCHVVQLQTEIIRKQAEAIEQAEIADAVFDRLEPIRKSADSELCEVYRFIGDL